jgi:hypothetical protein
MLVPLDPTRNALRWTQPDLHQLLFELVDGDRTVARLRIERPAGTLATGETAAAAWTFKRVGFLTPRVTARSQGASTDVGLFTPGWGGGGSFTLAGGRTLRWTPGSPFGPGSQIVRPDGLILAVTHPVRHGPSVRDLFRIEADVEVLHAAWHEADLPLLLVWTWYLMILAHHEETTLISSAAGAPAG